MNREEASFILANIDRRVCDDELNEALDMAIKALEQEPCETQMIDKSNFSQEQYKADLQCAYDCGKASVKPCEDAVPRQAVLDCLTATKLKKFDFILHAREEIKKLPPVNPQPKTGHWIFDEILDKHYYCSECKSMGVDYWDFCPNCGAKMVEPQESEG